MIRTLFLLSLLCLMTGPGQAALARSDVLFYASLNGQADADYAAGDGKALPGLNARFVPGLYGQALRTGKLSWANPELLPEPTITFTKDTDIYQKYGDWKTVGPLRYAATGNIRAEEGTLSFWMRPVNWKTGGRDRFIANLGMKDTLALFYSPYWTYDMFENYAGPNSYSRAIFGGGILREGAWEHITLSWHKNMMTWWQNGVNVTRVVNNVVPLKNATGIMAFGDGSMDETDFQDILILNRAITDEDAKALYYRLARKAEPPLITLGSQPVTLRGWNDALLGTAADDNLTVKMTRETDGLRVQFTYEIPEKYRANRTIYIGHPVKYEATADSATIFEDDFVEVDLRPGDSAPVYRFVLNGANTAFDDHNGDVSWNGTWTHETQLDDNQWNATLFIPWSDLGGAPAEGATWGLNLRHRAVHVEQVSTLWAFTGISRPWLGTLRFSTSAPGVDITTAGNPSSGLLTLAGRVTGAGTIIAEAVTTCLKELDPQSADIARDSTPAPGWRAEQSLASDGSFKFDNTFSKPLAADLLLTIKDSAGNVVFRQRRPFAYAVSWNATVSVLPTREIARVLLDAGSAAPLIQGLGAEITLKGPDGKVITSETVKKMTEIRQTLDLSSAGSVPGIYTVETSFISGSITSAPIVSTFEKKAKPAWMGNDLGKFTTPPAPWTPMETKALKVRCWGKEFQLGGLLPDQITILGEPILARPISLMTMDAKGNAVPLKAKKAKVSAKSPTRVTFNAEAKLPAGTLKSESWIEFDGFMWTTLTLPAGKIGPLWIEVPFKPQFATLWDCGIYYPGADISGLAPKTQLTTDFAPWIRLGDEEHGLQFSAESTFGWPGKGKMTYLPGKDAYSFRIMLVDQPTSLKEPLTIAFGIHALPARPRPTGLREFAWAGSDGCDPDNLRLAKLPNFKDYKNVLMYSQGWTQPDNNLELDDKKLDELAASFLGLWKNHNQTWLAYLQHAGFGGPVGDYYREEWKNLPIETLCAAAPTWADYHMYYLDRFLRKMNQPEMPWVGLYYDCTNAGPCTNADHGCGIRDANGAVQARQPILQMRETMKRIYAVAKAVNPNLPVTIHMSGDDAMAVWSFCDVMIEGEQYYAYWAARLKSDPKSKPNYYEMLPLDRIRAQYQPYAWGPQTLQLPENWTWRGVRPEYMDLNNPEMKAGWEHISTLMLAHGSIFWYSCYPQLPLWPNLVQWGWDDAVKTVPYWRSQELVKVSADTAKITYPDGPIGATVFQRPGKALVLLFNDTDIEQKITLTFNPQALGLKTLAPEVKDLRFSETFTLTGNTLTVIAPVRAGRFLSLTEK